MTVNLSQYKGTVGVFNNWNFRFNCKSNFKGHINRSNCHNPKGIKLVTRQSTGLSHLHRHKFKHSFQDSLNPICWRDTDVESCLHYFLYCPLLQNERLFLLSIVKNIEYKLLKYSDLCLTQILLFGDTPLDGNTSSSIFNTTIDFVTSFKKFKNH